MSPKEIKYTEKFYKYHCYKCNYSEFAPADIVDEFADMDEYCDGEYSLEQERKRKGMPVMECSNCNADFYYSGETKAEEGSYWIDEGEPSPF
jgi:predicted nucleic-acid-binding Zn-ribbon protein